MDAMKSLLLGAWIAVQCISSAYAIQGSDGAQYGIGRQSSNRFGFYRYTPETGTVYLYTFPSFKSVSDIIEGSDGAFYGITHGEVSNDGHGIPPSVIEGTFFRITKGGSFKTLAVFDSDVLPTGDLVMGFDGNFYGAANAYDNLGQDVIFRMTPTGRFSAVAYISDPQINVPGILSYVQLDGNLVIGPHGDLFGTSHFIDDESLRSVFSVSLEGVVTVFKKYKIGTARAPSRLTVGENGNLYIPINNVPYEIVTSNLPPIANNDSFELPTVHANVIANDTDPNIDPVQIVSVTDGSHGTVTYTPQGRVTYSPGPDYEGGAIQSDTFTYTIVDPLGGTSTATVTVSAPDNIFHAGAGGYRGLVTSGGLTKGRLNLALTKHATFSAALLLDSVKVRLKGIFAADGTATATVTRPEPLPPLTFALELDAISNRILATISEGPNSYSAILVRTLDIDSLIRPTPHRGKYTFLIENNETGPAVPGGSGFGTMSVTGSGAVFMTGKLGDGTPFSTGSTLDSNDNALLFVKAYSRDEGYLAGMVAFRITDTSDATGPMTWHKPPRPNNILYPDGFTTAPTFLATRYYMPAPPDFYYLNLGVSAMITVGDKPAKELRDRISAPFSLLAPKATGDKTHVTFDPETGLFRGAFFDGAIRYPLEGAIYQYDPARAGGLGLSQDGTVKVSLK